MIQRIQTVFLFFAFLLIGLLYFMPFGNLISNEVFNFSLKGITSIAPGKIIQQPYWITALGSLTALLIFVVIFLYKNRKLQINLTLACIILSLTLNASMYYLLNKYHILFSANVKFNIAFIFPLIAVVLLFLAYRSIKKDEQLIKSLNRLR